MTINQRVILIGPMGAGKSTLGRLLAEYLGWPYIDNDTQMAELTGLDESELSQLTVEELHEHENAYITYLSLLPAPWIAGAAASVVDYPQNIEKLKFMTVIYLRITIEQVIERAGTSGIGRGNIGGNFELTLRERYARRDPLYQGISTLTMNLGLNPESDAQKILSSLGEKGIS